MQQSDASSIYRHFVAEVAASSRAFGLTCHGEVVAVHGAGRCVLPLWSDADTAKRLAALHWPNLVCSQISLRELVRCWLLAAAESGIPAGIGVAPHVEAVVVPAARLCLDLIQAHERGSTDVQ